MKDACDTVLSIDGTVNELIKEACATKAEEYDNSDRSKLDKEINEACESRTLRTGLIHRLLILRSLILRLLIEVVIHNDISLKSYFDTMIIYLIIFKVNYFFIIWLFYSAPAKS